MFKKILSILMIVTVLLGVVVAVAFGASPWDYAVLDHALLEGNPLKEISYYYTPGGVSDTSSRYSEIVYSDAFLLGDSNALSTDLAKVSIALTATAYDNSRVNSLLEKMGFADHNNHDSYEKVNNLTLEDNDYVAYTIATKSITDPTTGEKYLLYCVPIKGTGGNGEWYSNFNIGKGGEHAGFSIAANRVNDQLLSYFSNDGMDADHRIVWLSGHSRGAACANLIAGWLSTEYSSYVNQNRVFAYTYACPSVSQSADRSLKNIYNFNNVGDLITMVPVDGWGFYRYGQTIELDMSDMSWSNFNARFQDVAYEAYGGLPEGDTFRALLISILGSSFDKITSAKWRPLILDLVAYSFDKTNTATIPEILDKHDAVKNLLNSLGEKTLKVILLKLEPGIKLIAAINAFLGCVNENNELQTFAKNAYTETQGMDEEDFEDYLYQNASKVAALETITGMDIVSANDFLTAYNRCLTTMGKLNDIIRILESANTICNGGLENAGNRVSHAHSQITYTVWINSMYYGYRGWYENTDIATVHTENIYGTIGVSCFEGCTGLTEVVLPQTVFSISSYAFYGCTGLTELILHASYLENRAFGGCKALKRVTIPVDYIIFGSPFFGCSKVREIHYTVGKTGIMPDRSFSSGSSVGQNTYYWSFLEREATSSLRKISFEEGITRIGNYAFCHFDSSAALSEINFPDTPKSIGCNAFEENEKIEEIDLPEGLIELGDSCFESCSGLKRIRFPSTLTEISTSCFGDCTSLTELMIPETVFSIKSDAFSGCTGLTKVVISQSEAVVEHFAFFGCTGLTDLVLETSNIGFLAFANCQALTRVTVPVDHSISTSPFTKCNIQEIHYTAGNTGIMPNRKISDSSDETYYTNVLEYVARNSLQKVVFEDGITQIGNNVFFGCTALKSLLFPNTVCSVGSNNGCSSITTVFYKGTQTQKEGLTVASSGNDPIITAKWHYEISETLMDNCVAYQCGKCEFCYYPDGTSVPLQQLTLLQIPTKTEYFVGESLVLDGLSMEGTYANGIVLRLDKSDIESTDANLSAYGNKTVTLTLLGCKVSYNVVVHGARGKTADVSTYPESKHNYSNNLRETKKFSYPGAQILRIKFSSETEVENGCDFIYIYDGSGKLVAKYTGKQAANKTLTISGDSFRIRLVTNGSITKYGYSFSRIFAGLEAVHPAVIDEATVTCTTDGLSQGSHCEVCGIVLVEQTPVPAKGHTEVIDEEVAATCTESGLTEGKHCSDCNMVFIAQEVVPAMGHTEVIDTAVEPTCETTGRTEGKHCTVCNAVLVAQETVPAWGHDYSYTTNGGGTHTGVCNRCDSSSVEKHEFTDGLCFCGSKEPTVDEAIKIYHTLDLASDISVTFAVPKTALASYDSYYLECVLPEYEGNTLTGTSTVRVEPVEKGNYYYFTLTGITAVRMGDMVDAVLHMTKGGAQYISKTDSYSVSTYAYAMLNSTTDSKMLTLCADLLRYGAEAQTFKKYRTDALVDAAMTDQHRSYLSDTGALTFTTTDSSLNDLVSPVIPWVGKTLDLGSKVGMKFVFNAKNYTGDIANLSMVVTYEGSDGATKSITLTGAEVYSSANSYYSFTFYGLLASELRTIVDVAIYEGETQLSETLRYSAESYASKNTTGTLAPLCKALFAYSDSAKAFFAK